MMDKIRIVNLGGQDEDYNGLTVVEINNDIFVIECGMRFPDKTKPGVDLIIPRYDYLIENKSKIRAYFITHGHDACFGALPFIYEKAPAPIYCTGVTRSVIKGFCKHFNKDFTKLNIVLVNASDDLLICNRKISLFQVATNHADSYSLSISTDQGDIVYASNFIISQDNIKGFNFDNQKIAQVCLNKTLVLLTDSYNANIPGYCSPHHKLLPIIRRKIYTVDGRVFLGIDSPDLFNICSIINLAVRLNKKIILYDENAKNVFDALNENGYLKLNRDSVASIEDVNRLKPTDVFVLITGYGEKLNSKVALLATKSNDEKIVFLTKQDTFIFTPHVLPENEVSTTEAIDELFKTGCKVVTTSKKEFLRMHACEEDIKTFISIFQPKYFVPVTGTFSKLLAAANIAVSANVGLNHNNVFIVDNGQFIEFEAGIGKISNAKAITGDVLVDGKGIGDIKPAVLEERQRLSDEGAIVLGVTISKSKHEIVAGPDVQARGLVFLKDNESLIKEITRLFVTTVNNEIVKENYSIKYIEEATKDIVFKAIRRSINKTPTIIPIISEIN